VGCALLSEAGDLDGVRCLPSDGVTELSAFKLRGAFLNAFKLRQLDQVRRRRARSEARMSFGNHNHTDGAN